jgi:hypothetical protein
MSDPDVLMFGLILAIPLVAIMGGIVHGIVRTIGRQRLMELSLKERIAAIERGVAPESLPPLKPPDPEIHGGQASFEAIQVRRAKWLKIAGLVCVAIGLPVMIAMFFAREPEGWITGLVFCTVGIALILGGRILRDGGKPA